MPRGRKPTSTKIKVAWAVEIRAALYLHAGRITAAARELGLARRTFYNRMRACGIDPDSYRPVGYRTGDHL